MATNHIDLLQEAIRLHHELVPFCTVTVADARGSIPQEIGAKALINRDGLICGTIGGGKIEARGCEKARELLAPGSKQHTLLERINLHKDVGMTCAGEMTLLYEVYRPDFDWNIIIFGAGHVAQKLCRLLVELDCRVTCFDPRAEWLDRLPDSARLHRRLVKNFADGVDSVPPGAFVVVMTMGHATDVPVLRALCQANVDAPFIGVLGSDSKAAILRRELRADGLPENFIARIDCPLGEKFGDNTPPEIAVSILAQLVRLRHPSANA
jgi:xanthine dehydrogenase accessory factor